MWYYAFDNVFAYNILSGELLIVNEQKRAHKRTSAIKSIMDELYTQLYVRLKQKLGKETYDTYVFIIET